MKQLKKLLSHSTKIKRRQRVLLNISITILAWVVEFLGFFLIFLGSFILGYDNAVVTLLLQIFSYTIYVIVCPCVLLANSYDMKNKISADKVYQSFINRFSCCQTVDEGKDANGQGDVNNDDEDVRNDQEFEKNEQNEKILTLQLLKELPFCEAI